MKKITLKKIAEHFNVSIATVSKALKDAPDIGLETREKIQKFAKENHYKPNSIALSLLNKETKTIGLVLPSILNYFFAKVLSGAEDVANQRGYKIITCITNESLQKEITTLDMLNSGTVDGIMISLTQETQQKESFDHLKDVIKNTVPLVMFDRITDEIECDKIIVNDKEGAYVATDHLIQTGCKNIALVSTIHNSSVGKLRVEGYKKMLLDQNITFEDQWIIETHDAKEIEKRLEPLLEKELDGILALDESSTIEIMRIVQKKGFSVPKDISIIGFTSGAISKYITPTVTSISQHAKNIGRTSIHKLIDRLEGINAHDRFETKVIKTTLVERNSTKKKLT
ncbi:catabolite control protein [Flavobacteriaceae bacterium UJ101]|nr:catabolite control protein [Flavobacteriaceae bacterium UJ101]